MEAARPRSSPAAAVVAASVISFGVWARHLAAVVDTRAGVGLQLGPSRFGDDQQQFLRSLRLLHALRGLRVWHRNMGAQSMLSRRCTVLECCGGRPLWKSWWRRKDTRRRVTSQCLSTATISRSSRARVPNAPGGARDYLQRGLMIGGFALIAWPSEYGPSGIKTFLVNQDDIIYEKDLGPGTGKVAQVITNLNPDKTWRGLC